MADGGVVVVDGDDPPPLSGRSGRAVGQERQDVDRVGGQRLVVGGGALIDEQVPIRVTAFATSGACSRA